MPDVSVLCELWAGFSRTWAGFSRKKWAEFSNGPGSPGPGSPAGRVHLIPQSTVVSTKIKRCHDVGDGAIGWVENALVVGIKSHIWSPGTFTRIFVYCISVSWSWAFTKYNNFPACVKFSSCKRYEKKLSTCIADQIGFILHMYLLFWANLVRVTRCT